MSQLMFNGREIQEGYVDIPGLGLVPVASLFPDGDFDPPDTGDEWELTYRVVCTSEASKEKHDKQGVATGVLERVWNFKAIRPGLSLVGTLTRSQKDEQFREGHGAA